MFDYLIVGAGPYGAVMAHELTAHGYSCLVIDRRDHIGGNLYTERAHGIMIHRYGAHIFHTSDERIIRYVNSFTGFDEYVHSPLARFRDEFYHLPFNMNTFHELFGVDSPDEARHLIEREIEAQFGTLTPRVNNLEEQAISLVGRSVYEKLIKGYTQKQWGRACTELPPEIIKRIPLRFEFNNNYFNDTYSAIPRDGYTVLIEKLLEGIEVRTGTDYLTLRQQKRSEVQGTLYDDPGLSLAREVIYSGTIDSFFDECYGPLEYRTLSFESEYQDTGQFQPCSVVNYTDSDTPFTRIIEHKHFDRGCRAEGTVITREYPKRYEQGDEPYYPINDTGNNERFRLYCDMAHDFPKVHFGGRLGRYSYYDMDKVIAAALDDAEKICNVLL